MSTADARVAIFSTGGTIASKRSADGAASPKLTADELVAAVPQLADVANSAAVSFRQVASSELTVSDMIGLAEGIGRAVADGATGTVVTQGTTVSEIAMLVRDKAKECIGTYVYKWPELAASTAAKLTCWTEVTI
jgi:L-asparaginase